MLGNAEILDTTLRDGRQIKTTRVHTLEDVLGVVKAIDSLGLVDYIEAGFAGADASIDIAIKEAARLKLNARIAAFGRVRAPNSKVNDLKNNYGIKSLLDVETPAVVLVYKAWDYQVPSIIGVDLEENLRMIEDTVRFFVGEGKEVIADAEFATAAFLGNPHENIKPGLDYLLITSETALNAGARKAVLCDTTGILMPHQVGEFIALFASAFGNDRIGFHGHNDHGFADANTFLAVKAGATHSQTTFTGTGERCGNASTAVLAGNLSSPYQTNPVTVDLNRLKPVGEYVHIVLTGSTLPDNFPFIGNSAFRHIGGMHADGNQKLQNAYNGRRPEDFGNSEKYPITLQSGTAHIAQALGVNKRDPWVRLVYDESMRLLKEGYPLSDYPEFFEVIAARLKPDYVSPFKILSTHLSEDSVDGERVDKARISVSFGGDEPVTLSHRCLGQVDAVIEPLKSELGIIYGLPKFKFEYEVHGYLGEGSARKVIVKAPFIVQNGAVPKVYTMIGISHSVIGASIDAITAGIEYALMLKERQKQK